MRTIDRWPPKTAMNQNDQRSVCGIAFAETDVGDLFL
jgi:hypothetical protein